MSKIQWGSSLSGGQILALRDAGLPDNTVNYEQGHGPRSTIEPIWWGSLMKVD